MAHRRQLGALLAAHLLLAVLSVACGAAGGPAADTWAVIVSSSRYWLNYRHASNALGIYQAVRRWAAGKLGEGNAWLEDWMVMRGSRQGGSLGLEPQPQAYSSEFSCCRLGIPDSHILLMLADQPSCSPRNVHPGQLYLAPGGASGSTGNNGDGGYEPSSGGGSSSSGWGGNLQSGDAEVDYRGREVGVESLLRVLTGAQGQGGAAHAW